MIRHIDNKYAVKAEEVAELCDNGKTGDARVVLCCGPRIDDNEWLFLLSTNGDDVLLTDDTDATLDFLSTLGCSIEEVTESIMASPADEESSYWARDQVLSVCTYEHYWGTVLGPYSDAAAVVREFDLDPTNRVSVDEWLGSAEGEATALGACGPALRSEHHEKALEAICLVIPWEARDEQGVRETLDAGDQEEAEAAARDWLRDADWDTTSGPVFADGDILLNGEWVSSVSIILEQDEPRCVKRYPGNDEPPVREHEWESGMASGVGGGVVSDDTCRHCGCVRTTHSHFRRPDTGELIGDMVTYEVAR